MHADARSPAASPKDLARDAWERQASDRVAREDLILFINACFAATGQAEFYSGSPSQGLSIDFVHDYILGNYRTLYARALAAGINHFNAGLIIVKLLASGKETPPHLRREEGALIARALACLPPQRAWKVLETLKRRRINNRRARAIIRDFVAARPDLPFDAVKYRHKVRKAIFHAHLPIRSEVGRFLFCREEPHHFVHPLFEHFRLAHRRYHKESLYHLPFTVAEGLAARMQIPRERFLQQIAPRLTEGERLRLQRTAQQEEVDLTVNLSRAPLTRLVLYLLSLPEEKRLADRERLEEALRQAARRALRESPLEVRKVAAVLDSSYSASGSVEKRRRPLAVAVALHYLLEASGIPYRPFWTGEVGDPLLARARGQTDLATPLLQALRWEPELLLVVSDGVENDPPRGADELLRVYRQKLDPQGKISIIHCNPVFDAENLTVKALSPAVPTVGLRDAEDLPMVLGYARFAEGSLALSALEGWLEARVQRWLQAVPAAPEEEG